VTRDDDGDALQPRLARFQYAAEEERLRTTRNDLPSYRLANIARRHLAAVVEDLNGRLAELYGWNEVAGLTVAQLKRLAATQLGALGRGAGGKPAVVRDTHDGEGGVLRIDFPGGAGQDQLEHVSWDQWFEIFDRSNLAFLYQTEKADGDDSTFFKLVHRS
jgi:hypothetical protein